MEQQICPLLCRICVLPVVARGVRLFKVDRDILSRWWLLHLDTQLDGDEDLENAWICQFCFRDARLDHYFYDLEEEHQNCHWWTYSEKEEIFYNLGGEGAQEMAQKANALEEESTVNLSLQGQLEEVAKSKESTVGGGEDLIHIGGEDEVALDQRGGLNQADETAAEGEKTLEEFGNKDIQQDQKQTPPKEIAGHESCEREQLMAKSLNALAKESKEVDAELIVSQECIEEKDKRMEIMARKLESMEKRLNEALWFQQERGKIGEAPPEELFVADREEGQPMAKKLKAIEVSAVDNSSLLWKLDECEKLQKQKDKTFEIMADHLQIMEKLLNQATEAKSKGDFTMKLLDDYITTLEEENKRNKDEEPEKRNSVLKLIRQMNTTWKSQILPCNSDKTSDEEDREEPRKGKSASEPIPKILLQKSLQVSTTDPSKYELCPDFLVSREKVDSLPVDVTMVKYVAKLMEYKYKNEKKANKHLCKFSLTGRPSCPGFKAKLMYPIEFQNALFDAANLKFKVSRHEVEIAISRKLKVANFLAN